MNGEKRKKIRTQLINFMNQELMNNKKSKKSNFLINSMTLEQLEKKNMQCKDFYIEEKNEIYENIDNGWVIGLNIYINNIEESNPLIYSLANIIKNNSFIKDIKNKNQININCFNTNNIETIIQKQSNKLLYIQKEGNVGSPVDTSLLIKKELGERILKRSKKECNSNKMPIIHSERFLSTDNFENEKVKIKDNKNDNKNKNDISKKKINEIEDLKVSKQLSNVTLETEISRIIQLCHEERYINSFEHYPSDTKKSKESKEIKRAKIYAKKLKLYCRTLKRKFPLNNEKNIKIRRSNIDENKIKKDIINENKNEKSKKIKKISSFGVLNDVKKMKEKIKDENDYKQFIPKKKMKSERNIKIKIKGKEESNKNNIATSSSNNKQYKTLDDKINKKRISLFKLKKKTKRKTLKEENKSKNKFKIKKFIIKSTHKLIKIRNKRLTQIHKTINDTHLLTDSPKLSTSNLHKKKKKKEKEKESTKNIIYTDPNKENKENKENNLKKLIRNRRNLGETNKNEKSTNITLVKDKKQRGSVDTKINLHGFEKLNFLKIKHKSTCEHFLFDKKIKKNKIIRNRLKNNTTISQQKDSSPSLSIDKKFIRKIKKKNNTDIPNNRQEEKQKTFGFLKSKKASVIIEALKKMKKRKSNNYEEKTLKSKRGLSLIYNENIKENNSKKVTKINNNAKFNSEETKVDETDIFNLMDEFLYRKKHERSGKL